MGAQVMAIYVRGELKPGTPLLDWPDEKDPVPLAVRLLEGIEGRRVHLFAEDRSPGWESFVGDEN